MPAVRAQIMPDSTVQICAYWTPGDKYTYRAEEEKFKINEQGDTTLLHRQSELRTFEIISQTKERYLVRLTYGEYSTTDAEDQRMNDAITAATGPCTVEFETDEMGSFLGITNLDMLLAQAEASAEPAVDAMWEGMAAEERKGLSKKITTIHDSEIIRSVGTGQCRERRYRTHALFPRSTARHGPGI